MFERYTATAREVVPLACREAAARGSAVVAPEHVVVALTQIPGSAAVLRDVGLDAEEVREALDAEEAEALARVGISLEAVREQIEATFGPEAWDRPPPSPGRRMALTATTKEVLAIAPREAATLGHKRVRPEHVLLALTCPNGRARSLLRTLGVSPSELRERTLDALAHPLEL